MKKIYGFILIGLIVGIIIGSIGNLLGRKILAYDAEYNFAGESGIDKDGNLVPSRPILFRSTLGGGVLVGAIAGILLGITGFLLKEGVGMIIGGIISFFSSGLICSPYFFYAAGIVPPVAHESAPYVLIPGIIIGVFSIVLLNRLKPPEMREVLVEEPEVKEGGGKEKHKHKKKK